MSEKILKTLDDLYPNAIRKTKGRVSKIERLSTLNSYHKAWGVVRKTPEVMVKLGRSDVKDFPHIKAIADYISRNGKLTLEDKDGNLYQGKDEYSEILKNWRTQNEIPEQDEGKSFARRIILSMPKGTDEKSFESACRLWAKDCLGDYDYLMTFHFEYSDKKTTHPHCHILLSTLGKDKKRLHLTNVERAVLREHFAVCLNRFGIRANCTTRFVRGRTQRPATQQEFNAAKRFKANKERSQVYAIAKKRKKTQLTNNQQARINEASEAIRQGKDIPDHPAIKKLKKKRGDLLNKAKTAAGELLQSQNPVHQELGQRMSHFYKNLDPVESQQQKSVRVFNEQKAERIRRMQAMKKRKKEQGNAR